MKTEDRFIIEGMGHSHGNERGKISTQFMSSDFKKKQSSKKNTLEEGLKMGGYEVNVRRPAKSRPDMQQPMAGYSDFWLG